MALKPTLGQRNRLVRRVMRHRAIATLFRPPEAAFASDWSDGAIRWGQPVIVEAQPEPSESEALAPAEPVQIPRLRAAERSEATRPPTAPARSQVQRAVEPARRPVPAPRDAVPTPAPEAPDAGQEKEASTLTEDVWRRLTTIFRRHQARMQGETQPAGVAGAAQPEPQIADTTGEAHAPELVVPEQTSAAVPARTRRAVVVEEQKQSEAARALQSSQLKESPQHEIAAVQRVEREAIAAPSSEAPQLKEPEVMRRPIPEPAQAQAEALAESDSQDTPTLQMAPLEATWQVERRGSTMAQDSAPPSEEQKSNTRGPTVPATEAPAPARMTRSSIEIIPPRRPRPQATPQTVVPQVRHAAAAQPEEGLVRTEIGPLPADLWTLINEPAPAPEAVQEGPATMRTAMPNPEGAPALAIHDHAGAETDSAVSKGQVRQPASSPPSVQPEPAASATWSSAAVQAAQGTARPEAAGGVETWTLPEAVIQAQTVFPPATAGEGARDILTNETTARATNSRVNETTDTGESDTTFSIQAADTRESAAPQEPAATDALDAEDGTTVRRDVQRHAITKPAMRDGAEADQGAPQLMQARNRPAPPRAAGTIQRTVQVSEVETAAPQPPFEARGAEAQEGGGFDLEELARRVYAEIKRRLSIERERSRGR